MSRDAIEYVKTLELGAADVIVLRLGDRFHRAAIEAIAEDVKRNLGDRRVCVLAPGLGLGAIPHPALEALRRVLQPARQELAPRDREALEQLLKALEGDEPAEDDRRPF